MARDVQYCAAPRCGAIVEPGKLMCKGHWFSLPKPLRDDVWRTWRAAQRNWRGRTNHDAQLANIRAYREAVRAAVEHLDGVPKTPASAMATTAISEDGTPVSYENGRLL